MRLRSQGIADLYAYTLEDQKAEAANRLDAILSQAEAARDGFLKKDPWEAAFTVRVASLTRGPWPPSDEQHAIQPRQSRFRAAIRL